MRLLRWGAAAAAAAAAAARGGAAAPQPFVAPRDAGANTPDLMVLTARGNGVVSVSVLRCSIAQGNWWREGATDEVFWCAQKKQGQLLVVAVDSAPVFVTDVVVVSDGIKVCSKCRYEGQWEGRKQNAFCIFASGLEPFRCTSLLQRIYNH